MVDILFVLTLFCLFAISSILLIILGANVYKKTIENMDSHFNTSTSVSYLTEKIRQSDVTNGLLSGSFNGQDALILEEEYNEVAYCTYIYSYDGYLKELFIIKDSPFDPSAGQNIIAVNDFKIDPLSDDLYKIIIIDKDNHSVTMDIHSKRSE